MENYKSIDFVKIHSLAIMLGTPSKLTIVKVRLRYG